MAKTYRCLFGLFLVVLWSSGLVFCVEELPQDVAPPQDVASPQEVVATAPDDTTPGIDSAVRMAQEEVRDPFAVAPETEAAVSAPVVTGPEVTVVLQGIGFGSKDAYAVIGGDVYYIGDEKNGIKLLEVRRREVDILVNGGKMTVPLFPDESLKKAKERAEKKSAVKNASMVQPSDTSSSS